MWLRYVIRTTTVGGATVVVWFLDPNVLGAVVGMVLLALMWVINDGPADRTTNACRLFESARAKPLSGSRTPLPVPPIPVPPTTLPDISEPDSEPAVTPELPAPRLTSAG